MTSPSLDRVVTAPAAAGDRAVAYDALLVVSFGGPEGMDDVIPFLENVLAGRDVPPSRLRAVAKHYERFGGVSPINAQNRALVEALRPALDRAGLDLPVYLGNRNWHPLLPAALQRMADDGVTRALAFFTTAYSCYSCCRQYREDIERARAAVGSGAPTVDKLRAYYNHPGFIAPNIESVGAALDQIPPERRSATHIVFTAHSIPLRMAQKSAYAAQLREAGRLVAEGVGRRTWQLAYQSRSGPPSQPWLEPDVGDHLRQLAADGARDVVLAPIGFISDHLEVLYDLDTEARAVADELGINLVRAATVGTHPTFVAMIRELIAERMSEDPERSYLGPHGPGHDVCPVDCCLPG